MIVGGAPGVVPPLTFRSRAVDELLEWCPERYRLFERFDADAHLVAVLNAVVHIEAVYRRSDEASKDRAAFSCFTIHLHASAIRRLGREVSPETIPPSCPDTSCDYSSSEILRQLRMSPRRGPG